MSGDVVERLRVDADEIEACGAGNEAATMRTAADLITSQAAEIERMTKENTDLMAARNENAKLKGPT